MMRTIRALVVAIAVFGALAACSSTSGYSDLDRAATSDDVLPAEVAAGGSDNLDLDSVRYVGRHEGRSFYLAQGDPQPGVCLAIYRDAESWVVGCGGVDVTVGGIGITATVIRDGDVVPEGGTLVGNNVVVLQSSGS
jgi:hypothetical protein